jgi:hypothetical protein
VTLGTNSSDLDNQSAQIGENCFIGVGHCSNGVIALGAFQTLNFEAQASEFLTLEDIIIVGRNIAADPPPPRS